MNKTNIVHKKEDYNNLSLLPQIYKKFKCENYRWKEIIVLIKKIEKIPYK